MAETRKKEFKTDKANLADKEFLQRWSMAIPLTRFQADFHIAHAFGPKDTNSKNDLFLLLKILAFLSNQSNQIVATKERYHKREPFLISAPQCQERKWFSRES